MLPLAIVKGHGYLIALLSEDGDLQHYKNPCKGVHLQMLEF